MIEVTLKESNQTVDLSAKIKATIEIDEQLDTSLDSGTINYLITEPNGRGLNEALAGYAVDAGDESFNFVGMDSRALLRREANRQSIYSHQVALTEPSKLLQGVMIDGLGVTRPETISYDNGTKTVSQDVAIQSISSGPGYAHRAAGVIAVSDMVDEITDVQGSFVGVTPSADYIAETGEIIWSAEWRDSTPTYSQPFTVTITYTYTLPNAATLKDVVDRLLTVTPFDGQVFTLTSDATVGITLNSVIAPQFKWNTQATLWECLLQVGAVIDAVPRLVADANGNYTVVTFEFVNVAANIVNTIDDGSTNVLGENVEENQYNTSLSSIVENIRENE